MHIVFGCPVAERAWVLPDWLKSIKSQEYSQPTVVSIVCIYTESHDDTLKILEDANVEIVHSSLPTRSFDRIRDHLWGSQNHEYEYMASLRNALRKEVLVRNADHFFSLDSDILLPNEHAVQDMIHEAAHESYDAVAPLVDMEKNPGMSQPAYNFMRIDRHGVMGERFPLPAAPFLPFQADVIMAAMLLNKKAQCVPWANHLQGEDIGWSLNARRMGIKVGVEPLVRCDHRMRIHG